MEDERGTVYVLHFHRPLGHARHYIGWTRFLEKRLRHHERGTGAKLMKALANAGIGYTIAVLYENETKTFERKLHNRKATPRWCPICKEARLHDSGGRLHQGRRVDTRDHGRSARERSVGRALAGHG